MAEPGYHKWWDDPEAFEKFRQNFTTSLRIEGPNMTLPDMSEKLCQMREEIDRLRMAIRNVERDLHEIACGDLSAHEALDGLSSFTSQEDAG